MTAEALAGRLKLSGLLISAGLLLETATLFWTHPLTFVAFIAVGGTLVAAGVAIFLYSIASR